MPIESPEVLDLHRSMHCNLRTIREGASKNPSHLFDKALRESAQLVLLLAGTQGVELEDRIQLLYEAGKFHEAKRALDQLMSERAWCHRWLYNRRHSQMIRAIRHAVAQPASLADS